MKHGFSSIISLFKHKDIEFVKSFDDLFQCVEDKKSIICLFNKTVLPAACVANWQASKLKQYMADNQLKINIKN